MLFFLSFLVKNNLTMVESIHPNLGRSILGRKQSYVQGKKMVSKISEYVMDKLEGEDTIYRSSDSVHKAVN
jgi:hypothetical protein